MSESVVKRTPYSRVLCNAYEYLEEDGEPEEYGHQQTDWHWHAFRHFIQDALHTALWRTEKGEHRCRWLSALSEMNAITVLVYGMIMQTLVSTYSYDFNVKEMEKKT